jgi:hypothetical protein
LFTCFLLYLFELPRNLFAANLLKKSSDNRRMANNIIPFVRNYIIIMKIKAYKTGVV